MAAAATMSSIDTFKQTLKGDVVESGSDEYSTAIRRWSLSAERNARYVVFPKDDADVSLAIKFATSNNIALAIKGGGHNPSGASSVDDGLCIDLSRYLNTARVDTEQRLVYVGGGATWKTVDYATIAHGLATPGGTVNDTGVGGLTLGGGYGWLIGEHGLVIDNLVQATVVLADGSVVIASSTSHPDLFWGLRGGGSNFGVVTEFVLKVHPQRKTVFAGPLIFPPSKIGQLAEAVDQWSTTCSEKEGVVMGFTRSLERQPMAMLVVFYNGSEEEGRSIFKRFYDLGPVAALASEIPYEKLNEILGPPPTEKRNFYMGGTSLRSLASLHIQEMYDRIVALSETHPKSPELPPYDILTIYEFFQLKKLCTVHPEATAFRSRGPQVNIAFIISWDAGEKDANGVDNARAISQELKKVVDSTAVRQPTMGENEGYMNYDSDLSQMKSKVAKQFGPNYPRLQKVKKLYDPNVVFNRWYPIEPSV